MEQILQQLLREVQAVRDELHELRKYFRSDRNIIEAMLRRRGIPEVKYTAGDQLLLPVSSSKEAEDELYRLMQKYSFRIFARDLITHIEQISLQRLARYCSEEVARQYLSTLLQHQILRQTGEKDYQFTNRHVLNFGDTLEWFVAQVMKREFDCPATYSTRFKDDDIGGDYDVLCAVEGRLAYIEVKSSPPKHIEMSEVTAFMDRVQNLRPEAAIFLEDTHLRMKDKLAVMFAEEMRRRYGSSAEQRYPVRRLHHEIFTIRQQIYMTNTKPDLIANLRLCLKHVLAGIKWPSPDD